MTYVPILILLAVALGLGTGILLLTHLFGRGTSNKKKHTPFECGFVSHGNVGQRLSVRFYMAAILFLLFDVGLVFLFPWAIVLKKYLTINAFILIEMGIFVTVLLVGYIYVLAKGALEWD